MNHKMQFNAYESQKKTADRGKKKFPGVTTCQINNESISTHA